MAGVAVGPIGIFKSALSVPITVSAPAPVVNVAGATITLTAITKSEMAEVLATADQATLDALALINSKLASIKLGMEVAVEEDLETDE